MMSPVSVPVLGASAVVCLPALVSVLRGTLPVDVGLARFLVVQLACWIALSALGAVLPRQESRPADGS